MDDDNGNKPRGGKNGARPAPATEATQQPAPPAVLLCDDDSAAANLQVDDDFRPDVVASVDESCDGGGAEEEDDDDEQVERFYALLANIRAMRGLPLVASSSSACGGSGDTDNDNAGDCTRKKRLRRSAEPPWRPAFRMEDFEEPPPTPTAAASSTTSCKLRKLTMSGAGHDDHGRGEDQRVRQSPSSSTSIPHAAVRFQQSDDSSRSCSRE